MSNKAIVVTLGYLIAAVFLSAGVALSAGPEEGLFAFGGFAGAYTALYAAL